MKVKVVGYERIKSEKNGVVSCYIKAHCITDTPCRYGVGNQVKEIFYKSDDNPPVDNEYHEVQMDIISTQNGDVVKYRNISND